MITYPDQPEELDTTYAKRPGVTDIKKGVADILEEKLPDCSTNKWFVESVYFANMVDVIVEHIIKEE